MAAPRRTTFEVIVSNRLQYNATYVQIQAELQYATHLSYVSNDHDSQKTYQQSAQSNKQANSYSKVEQKYDNNETHNKTSSNIYENNTQSTDVNVSIDVCGYGSGSTDVSHKSLNTKAQTQSSDKLTHNASSRYNSNYGANSSAVSGLNISSNEYNKDKSASSSSQLDSNKITPGFVRIACGQSLPIPVIVENESQVVYITV
eukprot:448775_1